MNLALALTLLVRVRVNLALTLLVRVRVNLALPLTLLAVGEGGEAAAAQVVDREAAVA